MSVKPTEILTEQYGDLIPTARLYDGKPRSILFDATKCIGCRHCVQACKDWNEHDRTSLYELSSTNWIPWTRRCSKDSRRFGRAIAACIATSLPARPYARSKR